MGKRGKSSNDTQLSKLQSEILIWLEDQLRGTDLDLTSRKLAALRRRDKRSPEELAKAADRTKKLFEPQPQKRKIHKQGVLWNAKQFYNDPQPTNSQQSALSRALQRLEKRGLVICSKKTLRTTHVALTEPGWRVATQWRLWGASDRDMRISHLSTPENKRHAELKNKLIKLRAVLHYALENDDELLEAKLNVQIKELEVEMFEVARSLRRASIEALLNDFPNSILVQGLKSIRAKDPDFFEKVIEIDPNKRPEK